MKIELAGKHAALALAIAVAAVVAALIIGAVAGRISSDGGTAKDAEADAHAGHAAEGMGEEVEWTCSMHPQIRQPDPGLCPICAMDLIPVPKGGDDLGPRTLKMSEEAAKLAEIQTHVVERRFVDIELSMTGKIDFDETRVKTISAWVPGRLDRLFVDYTGVPVNKGDHLVEIYSPDLYAAQEELIQAKKFLEKMTGAGSEIIRETAVTTLEAAREKLRLWGLSDKQVADVEERGTPEAVVEIKAPIGGIVIQKYASEGAYVKTGTPIYRVADLSHVWVFLDAYESDLPFIRYGQKIEIRAEAYGDEVFDGWISFVDPVLEDKSRVVKVRAIVDNAGGRLKPNMFVRATVLARVGADGTVVSADLSGKWICPMHPEQVADEAGTCGVCGMDLVPAESLGYGQYAATEPPVIVPATAVLATGKRAIVYLRLPDEDEPTFEGVQIELGPRAGDYYVVRSGLKAGDEVVTNGNFKIDSALQLLAKKSMMNPEEKPAVPEAPKRFDVGEEHRKILAGIYSSYIEARLALAGDDPAGAKAAAAALSAKADGIDDSQMSTSAVEAWRRDLGEIRRASGGIADTDDIQRQREKFLELSTALERAARLFGPFPRHAVRKFFCPMAFDNKGAAWLQDSEELLNPYFGAAMLTCGEELEVIWTGETDEGAHDGEDTHGGEHGGHGNGD